MVKYKIVLVDGKKKKVKACAHCGSLDFIVDTEIMNGHKFGFIECLNEDCYEIMRADTETHAVEMWNRRPKRQLCSCNIVDTDGKSTFVACIKCGGKV